jgi:hypothetical protein
MEKDGRDQGIGNHNSDGCRVGYGTHTGASALKRLLLLFLVCLLSLQAKAQNSADDHAPLAPRPEHRFWDRENVLLFSGIALFRGLDYASTRNFMARGRTEVLISDDVVNNSAGFASLEAAATATSVGISYIFHRSGHHRMERWLSIAHIGVTGFGVTWNYSLKSKRLKR